MLTSIQRLNHWEYHEVNKNDIQDRNGYLDHFAKALSSLSPNSEADF
jgi:hypothetical protein